MAILQARNIVEVTQSVTRPANADIYAVTDVIDLAAGAGLTFTNCARGEGMGGIILDAMIIDSADQAGTELDVELWLFKLALAAYDNDNDEFTPTDADLEDNLQCILDFTGNTNAFIGDSGTNLVYLSERTYLPQTFVTAAASVLAVNAGALFGVLVARNTYTPVSAEKFTVKLKIEQA